MHQSAPFQPSRRAFIGATLALGVAGGWPGSAMAATPAQRLVAAARGQVGVTLAYDPAYTVLGFPGGDVARAKGVCTDVVIRAFRDALALDLQALVNADMKANFAAYPKNWGLRRPDRNIDHRRVPNLATYWTRQRARLPISSDPADWRPGDIFTSLVGGKLPHTGIVSDRKTASGRPLVLHNIGAGTREEDALFDHRLTGHFRWKV
ncbi:hypothetical protein FHR22_002567 [Sphingopyxis panaciterrae]|uniref:DUF1287 domain-containing protein n=1 Tax=Sphingopyxis panaciterrae TaxID=363841 RepID=UPI001ABA1B22|nr:DUF1287 domain-containing protein [Sphingopyxis panaciterrae]NIJ37864.1 hypothetical protein [Sphingopyxis panaciterrae]